MASAKIVSNVAKQNIELLISRRFSFLYPQLSALLDKIKNVSGKDAASAYSDASSGKMEYGKDAKGKVKVGADGQPADVKVVEKGAKDVIKELVDQLSPQEIGYLSGLNFTAPNDDKKKRTDVVNSVLTAWDKSAAKYMKQERAAGDAARKDLQARLAEFDTAIRTQGKTPVKPDA